MTKQLTCEERIDAALENEIEVLRDLWEFYCEGGQDDYHPEHESNMWEYGLSFDYVPVGTWEDQTEGYFRYQLSWGGPSDEFRFFVSMDRRPYRIQYHFMDWFDGAKRILHGTDEALLEEIFGWFAEGGGVDAEFEKAIE